MILMRKVVCLKINLIFSIHLMQLKANLIFGMSFILILTQKSLVLLHVEQLPSILTLVLLSNHQSWSDVKQIKDCKRSNLFGTSLEKRAMLYSATRLNEAQIKQTYDNNSGASEDLKMMMIFSLSFFQQFLTSILNIYLP